jgi:hypothetical protein
VAVVAAFADVDVAACELEGRVWLHSGERLSGLGDEIHGDDFDQATGENGGGCEEGEDEALVLKNPAVE